MDADKPGAMEIIELLLTADIYNSVADLGADDLPQKIRDHYRDPETGIVSRPVRVTLADVEKIYGIEGGHAIVRMLPFIEQEESDGHIWLDPFDSGAQWLAHQDSYDLIQSNPVLAFHYQKDDPTISYAEARWKRPPVSEIEARIEKMFGEEADSLMKLVTIKVPGEVRSRLDELVLTDEQHEEIAKAQKALEYRDYLKDIGLFEIGKILLVGPPGTGKTSSARALGRWFDLPLVEVNLSMLISKYLGETSKNIDNVFMLAKKLGPCILFIDEFDFVAKTRDSDDHGAMKRAVNTLLKAVDEVSLVEDGVLLVAATNYPQLLDHAAWRRFDKVLSFTLPDEDMRSRILAMVLRRMDASVDADALARLTAGYSGSDLRLVVREAVLNALLEDRKKIDQKDLLRAVAQFQRRMDDHRANSIT
ncbi:MAG TPA: ATP-binding protein [Syntrophobacter fumaroxidans]|nr:ATP-binding protein [Syntrophobacter fumaroxidans]